MAKRILFAIVALVLVFVISVGSMVYALDSRSEIVKSVSHEIVGDKIVFTVVTVAGDYNRIKVTTADNLSGSLGVGNTYTVDGNGNYVWTIKAAAPTKTTTYAFDLRVGSTNKYRKDYYTTTVEHAEATIFKSTSYEIVDGKVIFTAITPAGDYNRVKISLLDNITSYVKYTDSYTVNADGDYVWTLKFNAPTALTEYALDVRVTSTMKYVKDYYYVSINPTTVEPEPNPDTVFVSGSGVVADGRLTFTIVTLPTAINRVKVMLTSNQSSYVKLIDKYTVNAEGNYVWTATVAAPNGTTSYTCDVRSSVTSKYMKDYFTFESSLAEETNELYQSVSYKIDDDRIVFTVVTSAGDYNRIKVAYADDVSTSLGVGTYTTDKNGNYVWTVKAAAPTAATTYAFDLRTTANKYLKDYYNFKVEIVEDVDIYKSASYEIVDDKIVFTVVTSAGDYNRIKVTTADALSSSLGVGNYTVDKNGNYVWTIKVAAPTSTTIYAFDLRTTANKYLKDYYNFKVEIVEDVEIYKSVSYEIVNGKVVFTVVTSAGDYNRIKVTTADALSSSLGVGNYTVADNGDYVWTVKADVPTSNTTYAFDLRVASTNKYLKDYYMTDVEINVETPSHIVTFLDWDGKVLKTESVEEGKSATAPSDPVREGYTFVGWDKAFDNITEAVIVTATYEQNITAPTLKVADVSAAAGQSVQVPINIINNPGIAGAIITVSYDGKLTLSSASNGEAFSFLQFSAPGKFANPCKFAWDSEDGETKENGAVLYLTFDVPATAKSGDVYEISCSYRAGDIFNNNWDDVVLEAIGGTITVS